MSSQKRNTQNLTLKEENILLFLEITADCSKKKVYSITFFLAFSFFVAIKRLPPLLGNDGGVVIVRLLILSYQSNCWQAGYDMDRGVVDLCWTCLETCLELPKSRYLISLHSDLMDEFDGSRRFDDHHWNNSAARESSRVIILKSRLISKGHSARTSEVCDIFDRQTHVPNDWWQLMCSHVLQRWERRNSLTAPVRNITVIPLVTIQTQSSFQLWVK